MVRFVAYISTELISQLGWAKLKPSFPPGPETETWMGLFRFKLSSSLDLEPPDLVVGSEFRLQVPKVNTYCWEISHPIAPRSWVRHGFKYLFRLSTYQFKLLGWHVISISPMLSNLNDYLKQGFLTTLYLTMLSICRSSLPLVGFLFPLVSALLGPNLYFRVHKNPRTPTLNSKNPFWTFTFDCSWKSLWVD